MSEGQRPDTAADLSRIHAMITHALEGARAQLQDVAEGGLAGPGSGRRWSSTWAALPRCCTTIT